MGSQAAKLVDDWSFYLTVENTKSGRFDQYAILRGPLT
jgi:hypothetical protein